jgi:putative peptidoglycan lipid II flippase
MVKDIFTRGRQIIYGRQADIFSAAAVIMLMVSASRLLGLLRNRVFVHFFSPEELDAYLAAFQLPDLIFEILVVGSISSAFIPVFTKYLSSKKQNEAWQVANMTLTFMLSIFLIIAFLILIFAKPLYGLVARGFTPSQVEETVSYAQILLIAQIFFVASYVFTAVLESHQRFLIPALAPIFYNLSIILFTVLFVPVVGLMAPVIGAVVGSILHLAIQVPVAMSLGFSPRLVFSSSPVLGKIIRLAAPRVLELSVLQLKKLVDLALASLVAGGITYFRFADSLAALPVSLFGLSLAKASLPSLAMQSVESSLTNFKNTFVASFGQILFFIAPASVFLIVLRVPIVRLAFGGARFDWQDTLQTGYTLSAFAIGIFAASFSLLISRAFYALHDTKTPLKISIMTIFLNVVLGLLLITVVKLPTWGLALSWSVASIIQVIFLFVFLSRKVGGFASFGLLQSFLKTVFCSFVSGSVMFVLLRIFDRSAWDKKLSFLGNFALPTTFDRFVIDTRYTVNLIILTLFVAVVGLLVYLFLAWLLRVREFAIFVGIIRRLSPLGIRGITRKAVQEGEVISPPYANGS